MSTAVGGDRGADMATAVDMTPPPPDLFGVPHDLTIETMPSARNPPDGGALWGAFVGIGDAGTPEYQAEEQLIDRPWVIDNRFYSSEDWGSDRGPWDLANHKIPLVTWQPPDTLDDILAGKEDALIDARAAAAKAWGGEFFIRWGHEMNGNWYAWAGINNGGANGGPAKYIAAYRYVHDRMVKTDGVTNSVWVWCFNVVDVPDESWNHWTNYYPGDDYVDWVGLDAYNWGTSVAGDVWISFADLVSAPYADYSGRKPMMLPETSSAEVGGNKAAWIMDMQNQLETKFTNIKAIVWFDINKETDWRIDSSPLTLAAYTKMGLDPYFLPNP